MKNDIAQLEAILKQAIEKSIQKIGYVNFKKTSFFGSKRQ